MKTQLLLICMLIGTLSSGFGQSFRSGSYKAGSYVERTIASPMVGTSIVYEGKRLIEIGGFIQKSMEPVAEGRDSYKREETHFYGAYFAYPLIKINRGTVIKFHARTGVTNGQNFIITPGIIAQYSPYKKVTISGGFGGRSFMPTLIGQVQVRLSK